MASDISGSGNGYSTYSSELNALRTEIVTIKCSIDSINKTLIQHQNLLNDRKQIVTTYVDAVLSKIDILKNIITKNVGDTTEFVSHDLMLVEQIENQIKSTGKISKQQFQMLNDIYRTQKDIKK